MNDKKETLVPALRFGEFEGEWEKKKIGELCDFIVPGRNKPTNFTGDIPWITTPDILHSGTIEFSKKELGISREEAKKIGSKIVPVNAIIISCVGELGLVALAGKEIVINQQLHAFIPKEKINNKFLLHSISTQKKYMLRTATKTAVLYMNKDNCNSIPILFPLLPEQQKIANFLSSVDKKIEQLRQKVNLLEDYKKGVMQQVFSQQIRFKDDNGEAFSDWEVKKLKEVTKINQGLQIPISKRYKEKIKDSFFYITNEFLKEKSQKKYFIKNPSKSVLCNEEDILMTRTGNTGQVVTGVKGVFHNNFFKIKFNKENCYKWYLYYFLKSFKTQRNILKLAGSSTIPDLNHGDFYNIKMPFPIIKEQEKIANYLSSIDEKIQQAQTQLAQAQQFKKGLLQQLFV